MGKKSQAARFPSAGHRSSPPIGPLARTQLNSPNLLPPSTAGCVRWAMAMGAYINSPGLAPAVSWLMRSPPPAAAVPDCVLRITAPQHRWAAAVCAAGIACIACCLELERLTWCSPPAGTACRLRAPGNAACRQFEPLWGSLRAGTVYHRRARCSSACRLSELPWSSPRAGRTYPHHARDRAACRIEQQ